MLIRTVLLTPLYSYPPYTQSRHLYPATGFHWSYITHFQSILAIAIPAQFLMFHI
ncbi:hypothetical protein H6G97_21020 [Nostoc flagelliforme FACHB-838]|uniref:Uncharacterized protein n=1 Tax=Nostoc flagelliforme FACHB-838 TaxID=2692904 RepID=A0ABR8DS26_9NOSO|nr:hypothetical protein [Nostoc flagelliforme]MBD2531933.1 hypothetical protein [Nostoc flagelliforme FACHB-838]